MTATRIQPPPAILDLADRLERAGHATWCVGGAIRDALLGHPHLDWDLATAATPEQVRDVFGGRRTVPIGLAFGTVGVLGRDGALHEVTTFRRDVRTDGRHAEVEFGATIDEDLARRDFTINAIAYRPSTGELRDPFGGVRDLEARLVRAVGDPAERMREDRLRALRAIRFAGRLKFAIDPATWDAIVASAPHLTRLSAERVKQEIEKTMEQVDRPAAALRLWAESGALAVLIPALAEVRPGDLDVVDLLPMPRPGGRGYRKLLRLAAFFGVLGAARAEDAMRALRFSRSDIAAVVRTVDRADRLRPLIEQELAGGGSAAPAAVRRWVAIAGRLDAPTVMRLLEARWRARGEGPDGAAIGALYRRMLRSALRDPVDVADLAVDGDDLRRAGIPAGPALGKILHALLDRVIDDPSLNTPGTLLAIARELYHSGPDASGAG